GGTLTLLGSGLTGSRLIHSPVAAFWAMAAGARQTVAAAVSTMRRKTFTVFLLGCGYGCPAFSPDPFIMLASVGCAFDPRWRCQQRQPHAPSLPPKTQAAKPLLAWKAAHVGDDIGNIVRRQRTFEGWHVAAFAVGRTAFADDAGHVAIVEQLGVALAVEGAHMGHEIFAAAAAVGTVAARTITLQEPLTPLAPRRPARSRVTAPSNTPL